MSHGSSLSFKRSVRRAFGVYLTATILALTAVLAAQPVSAKATKRDLAIATKAFDFVEPSLGAGAVAVVYDPANAASKAAAEEVVSLLPGKTKKVSIAGSAVPISDTAAIGAADAVFLVEGLSADVIAASLAGSGRLCFTTVRAYVDDGHCVMAVSSKPKVEIVVNAAAAAAFGVGFGSAFRMMIKEI